MIQRTCNKCHLCSLNRRAKKKFGVLPPKEAEAIPWHTLAIDVVGSFEFIKGEEPRKVLSMIDPATGWLELALTPIEYDEKGKKKGVRADTIINLLELYWFNRYPWPEKVICDKGSEFQREVSYHLLNTFGTVRSVITSRNPQANSIVERMHQVLNRTVAVAKDEINHEDLLFHDEGIVSACAFAMRATLHTTTQATPVQLVFHRDAIHNIGFEPDWKHVKDRKQHRILQNNKKENATRTPHEYKQGDRVKVLQDKSNKHGGRLYEGPYTVTEVHANGTVTLQHSTPGGGGVEETIWNIRNIHPYEA